MSVNLAETIPGVDVLTIASPQVGPAAWMRAFTSAGRAVRHHADEPHATEAASEIATILGVGGAVGGQLVPAPVQNCLSLGSRVALKSK
jgi:hypothetical protein